MDLILGAVEDICRTKKGIQGGGGNDEEGSKDNHTPGKSKKLPCEVLTGHKGSVYSCQFFHADKYILSTSEDKTVKIWNVKTRECIHTFRDKQSLAILRAHVAPDDMSFLTAGLDKRLLHWSLETNQAMWEGEHNGIVLCCRFSRDGQLVASGTDVDHELKIWDLRTQKPVHRLKDLHSQGITSVKFTNQDDRIITTSMDRTIKVYDLKACKNTLTLHGHKNIVSNCTFDVNSRNLATASWDKSVFIWDIPTGKYRRVGPIKLTGHEGCVSSCVISQDGHFLISGSYDESIIIWDLNDNLERIKLMDHTGWVEDVDISQNQSWLVSCSRDRTIRIWDISKIHSVQSTTHVEKTAPKVMQCLQCLKPFIPSLEYGFSNGFLMCAYCNLDADAKRESELEAEKESELEAESEPELLEGEEGSGWESESEPELEETKELESGSEPELEAQPEPELEAKSEPKLEAKDECDLEAVSGSELDLIEETELEAERMSELEAKRLSELEVERLSELEAKKLSELEVERLSELEAKKLSELEAKSLSELEAERLSELEAKRLSELEAERLPKLEAERLSDLEAKKGLELEPKQKSNSLDTVEESKSDSDLEKDYDLETENNSKSDTNN